MGTVAGLYRHPIKSHGREALQSVTLEVGKCMPWDRHWAVAHDRSKFDRSAPEWISCGNFARGAKASQLMAIDAKLDEGTGVITLTHPQLDTLSFNPDIADDAATFIDWVTPIMPTDWFAPSFIARAPDRGMTDTDYPSISINSHATNEALSDHVGEALSPLRWRGNIWIDGFAPWEEFNWVGKDLTIGDTVLAVRARIERCNATKVDPSTGNPNIDTLDILNSKYGHQDFGVYIEVIKGGDIKVGDTVSVL